MPLPASAGLGAFAQGFVGGAVTRQELELAQNRDARAAATHGVQLRSAQLDVARKEKEQPILDKELQLRGSRADYEQSEVDFKKGLQDFENETKRI
jgi:multidrug resistance efflux pump